MSAKPPSIAVRRVEGLRFLKASTATSGEGPGWGFGGARRFGWLIPMPETIFATSCCSVSASLASGTRSFHCPIGLPSPVLESETSTVTAVAFPTNEPSTR